MRTQPARHFGGLTANYAVAATLAFENLRQASSGREGPPETLGSSPANFGPALTDQPAFPALFHARPTAHPNPALGSGLAKQGSRSRALRPSPGLSFDGAPVDASEPASESLWSR